MIDAERPWAKKATARFGNSSIVIVNSWVQIC
jgi:hypothetical protein